MEDWKLVRRTALAALAALATMVCLVAATSAPAALPAAPGQPEGQRYSWDTEPQFVTTEAGERILFARATDGLDRPDDGPWQRLMLTESDGSNTAPYKEGSRESRDFHAAPALFGGQIAYESWNPAFNEETGEYSYTSKLICLGESVGVIGGICVLGDGNTPLTDPALSATGDRIAWEKGVNIQVAEISPFSISGIEWVAMPPLPEASKPAFSRDGDQIVFVGDGSTGGDSDAGIWIVPSDGSGPARRLTGTTSHSPCYEDSAPVWQPFVDRVVFVRNALACGEDELAGLWRIDPDSAWSDGAGLQGQQLVAGNSKDVAFSEPAVSRTGTRIAYVRRSLTEDESDEAARIHLSNMVFDSAISDAGETGVNFDSHPSFSSSGQYVTFQRRADKDGEPADSLKSGIYRVDENGNDQVQITQSFDYFQESCCAPPKKPRLKIRVRPSKLKLKARRTRFVRIRVTRSGSGDARQVKVCAKGPRILRFPRKCRKFNRLKDGGVLVLTEPIRLKRKLRRTRRFKVRFTVRGPGLTPARAVLRVRGR